MWWWEIESLISENIFKLELQIQFFGDHFTQSILPYLYTSPHSGNLITGVIQPRGGKTDMWKQRQHTVHLDHTSRSGFEVQHKGFKMYVNF